VLSSAVLLYTGHAQHIMVQQLPATPRCICTCADAELD